MGLLDDAYAKARAVAGLLSDAYQTGAQAYFPNEEDVKARPEIANGLLQFVPGPGDAISGYEAAQSAKQGNYGEAALNGVGLLPFIPAMGGMIKGPLGRIPETGAETRALADMLKRAGEKAGYSVSHSGSGISPSQYVTFTKIGDELGGSARQVRLSNHADKYPELADGVRTSVDPSTEVSFEQAVNWLSREGFPTSLSSRYKGVPSWEEYYAAQRALRATNEVKLQKMIDAWRNQPKSTRGPMPTFNDIK